MSRRRRFLLSRALTRLSVSQTSQGGIRVSRSSVSGSMARCGHGLQGWRVPRTRRGIAIHRGPGYWDREQHPWRGWRQIGTRESKREAGTCFPCNLKVCVWRIWAVCVCGGGSNFGQIHASTMSQPYCGDSAVIRLGFRYSDQTSASRASTGVNNSRCATEIPLKVFAGISWTQQRLRKVVVIGLGLMYVVQHAAGACMSLDNAACRRWEAMD